MKDDDTVTISNNGEPTETIFKEYVDYKRGFETNYLAYFSNITESRGSPFLNKFVTREVASCNHRSPVMAKYPWGWRPRQDLNYVTDGDCKNLVINGNAKCAGENDCKFETHEKLQVVEIYFATPTFDKITKDAKTNSIAKLSMIGGTLGLLTGK